MDQWFSMVQIEVDSLWMYTRDKYLERGKKINITWREFYTFYLFGEGDGKCNDRFRDKKG